jgi:radical SAM superfamily enzyme YgiQ (UPF0313 family)
MNREKKKSVVFIEPTGNESSVFENYMRLPLMGSLYLGTILHNNGYTVKIFNENILGKKIDPFNLTADVFCITSLTVSANRAKILAEQIRRIHPDSKIIVGGIHASLVPGDFMDVADYIVKGEAEEIIVDLVEGKFDEKIVEAQIIENIENLPLINYGILVGVKTLSLIPIMTSRGCPFDCNFCTVTKIFGRKFRMFSAERIIAEIKHALPFFNTRNIFFYDDNFAANKKRINKLCDLLISEKIKISWTAQVRSDIARSPDTLEKMKQAGCRWLYIGFESISDKTLKALHKSQNRLDIENAIKVIHEKGINIHGMFMFGEDNDTVETIKETVQFAIKQYIDTVQFMVLTPFPGTQVYEKISEENRFFHNQWDYFDGMYIVFRPRNMDAATLQQETVRAYRKFYSMRRILLDGLKLTLNIFIDALVWDFRSVKRYDIDAMLLKAGGKFLVSKFVAGYDEYIKFLINVDIGKD